MEKFSEAFLSGSKSLLKSWKNLRSDLSDDKSDIEHLKIIVNFWSYAPVASGIILNWDDPKTWLSPWEFITEMEFDDSSVSLGMAYTLQLSKDNRWNDRWKLILIKDDDIKIQKIVLMIDDKFLLNYEYRSIINLEKEEKRFIIQQHYAYNGKVFSLA